MVKALLNSLGVMIENMREFKRMVTYFYKIFYTSEGVHNLDLVLQHVMNEILCAPYSANEVKIALFQMFPTKLRGPDGFPTHFINVTGTFVGRSSIMRF